MYSKTEASQLKQEFWTTFGQYMSPVTGAEGIKVNWVNYKTGVKHIYFRMKADNKSASVGIELTHPDRELQQLFFDEFTPFKTLLDNIVSEQWQWERNSLDEHGKAISHIFKQLNGISVFNKGDWPDLISFFKPRIIALDEFWSNVKYHFEGL